MKRTISFGKCDYWGKGRKVNEMTVDIELREQSNGSGLEFSATYAIWNGHHTDLICGGCSVEDLKKFIPNNQLLNEICDIASKWHLNGLHSGTHKQEESVNKYFKRIGKPYDYDLAVKHLKKVGLLVDKLDDGEILNCETEKAKKDAYTYGCGWITYTLPDKVVERVKEIINRDYLYVHQD